MSHTQDAVVYDENGIIQMIVIPDHDSELDDPSFNPSGMTQIRIPALNTNETPMSVTQAAIAAAAAQGITIQLMPSE